MHQRRHGIISTYIHHNIFNNYFFFSIWEQGKGWRGKARNIMVDNSLKRNRADSRKLTVDVRGILVISHQMSDLAEFIFSYQAGQGFDEDATFKFKHKIPLKKCFLKDTDEKGNNFQIETVDKRVFSFSAEAKTEKDLWYGGIH